MELMDKGRPEGAGKQYTGLSTIEPRPTQSNLYTPGGGDDWPARDAAEQLIPEKEFTFQDDEANKVYVEHLRRKERIRERIEALSREQTFLNQLNPDQYAYMYQKQHEARLQKEKGAFEARFQFEQARKKRGLSPPKRGDIPVGAADFQSAMKRLEEEDQLTEEDKQRYRVKRVKDKYLVADTAVVELDEAKLTGAEKDRLAARREDIATAVQLFKSELDPGLFYEQVTPQRAKELATRMAALRAENHLRCGTSLGHDNVDIDLLEGRRQFDHSLQQFARQHATSEATRTEAINRLIELKAMARFLVDERDATTLEDAQARRSRYRKLQATEGEKDPGEPDLGFLNTECGDEVLDQMQAYRDLYKPSYDPKTGRRLFDIAIKDVKVWGDAAGAVDVKSWNYAKEVHEEKLAKSRQTKEYQSWCAADEEDIEAERVVSDIKNLYGEVYFNVYFSEIDHTQAHERTLAEQKVSAK